MHKYGPFITIPKFLIKSCWLILKDVNLDSRNRTHIHPHSIRIVSTKEELYSLQQHLKLCWNLDWLLENDAIFIVTRPCYVRFAYSRGESFRLDNPILIYESLTEILFKQSCRFDDCYDDAFLVIEERRLKCLKIISNDFQQTTEQQTRVVSKTISKENETYKLELTLKDRAEKILLEGQEFRCEETFAFYLGIINNRNPILILKLFEQLLNLEVFSAQTIESVLNKTYKATGKQFRQAIYELMPYYFVEHTATTLATKIKSGVGIVEQVANQATVFKQNMKIINMQLTQADLDVTYRQNNEEYSTFVEYLLLLLNQACNKDPYLIRCAFTDLSKNIVMLLFLTKVTAYANMQLFDECLEQISRYDLGKGFRTICNFMDYLPCNFPVHVVKKVVDLFRKNI